MVGNNFEEIVLDEPKDVLLEVQSSSSMWSMIKFFIVRKLILMSFSDIIFFLKSDICSLVWALPITRTYI